MYYYLYLATDRDIRSNISRGDNNSKEKRKEGKKRRWVERQNTIQILQYVSCYNAISETGEGLKKSLASSVPLPK